MFSMRMLNELYSLKVLLKHMLLFGMTVAFATSAFLLCIDVPHGNFFSGTLIDIWVGFLYVFLVAMMLAVFPYVFCLGLLKYFTLGIKSYILWGVSVTAICLSIVPLGSLIMHVILVVCGGCVGAMHYYLDNKIAIKKPDAS